MENQKRINLQLLGWSSLTVGVVLLVFELVRVSRPGLISTAFGLPFVLPGAFADTVLSMIFSAQGGHGQILPYWLVVAVNWTTYSIIVYFLLALLKRTHSRRSRKSEH